MSLVFTVLRSAQELSDNNDNVQFGHLENHQPVVQVSLPQVSESSDDSF